MTEMTVVEDGDTLHIQGEEIVTGNEVDVDVCAAVQSDSKPCCWAAWDNMCSTEQENESICNSDGVEDGDGTLITSGIWCEVDADDVDDADDARNDDTLQNDARDDTLPNRTHSARCQLGFPSCNVGGVPGGKADMNNCGGIASDFIGGSWTYPEATYADRKAVWCVNIVVYIIL